MFGDHYDLEFETKKKQWPARSRRRRGLPRAWGSCRGRHERGDLLAGPLPCGWTMGSVPGAPSTDTQILPTAPPRQATPQQTLLPVHLGAFVLTCVGRNFPDVELLERGVDGFKIRSI